MIATHYGEDSIALQDRFSQQTVHVKVAVLTGPAVYLVGEFAPGLG